MDRFFEEELALLKEFLSLDELKKLNWERITALQNKRLAATSRTLAPHIPFYKKLFEDHGVNPGQVRSPEDWKRLGLPLIKKKSYIDDPRAFIVRPEGSNEQIFMSYVRYASRLSRSESAKLLLKAPLSKILSGVNRSLKTEVKSFFRPKMPAFAGGSETGKPTPVLLTANQKLKSMMNTADISAYLIITRHFDDDETTTGMNLFPYAPHIAWQIINMAAELRTDLNLSTAAGGFLGTEKLLQIARSARPNVFSGMVDYMINIFLPRAIDERVALGKKVVFLNGATKMLEIQRRELKTLFRQLGVQEVIALDGYGASELKEATLAECEEGSGLHHVAPLSSIIRTVKINKADPSSDLIYDWEFTNDGEGGYAAIWNIDGAGTILLGYLLGDHYEKMATDRCPNCGMSVQRVYNINRVADIETEMRIMGLDEEKVQGAVVNLTALREQLLHLNGVKEAQITVEHGLFGDRLSVKYAARRGFAGCAKLKIIEIFRRCSDVHPAEINKVPLSHFYGKGSLKYSGIVRKHHAGN